MSDRKVECVQYVGTEIVEEIVGDDNIDVKDDSYDKNLLRIVVNIVEEMFNNSLTITNGFQWNPLFLFT